MRVPLLFLPLLAGGCSGGGLDTHDACTNAEIQAMRDFTAILEGIRDRKGVEAARPKMEALVRRVAEIRAAQEKLGAPGPEAKARTDAAREELDPRMLNAMASLHDDPEAVKALTAMLNEFGPRIAR